MRQLGIEGNSCHDIGTELFGELKRILCEKMGEDVGMLDDDHLKLKLLEPKTAAQDGPGDDGPHRGPAKRAARPQQLQQQREQPPDAPNPKRTRTAGGPSAPAGGVQPGAGGDARTPTGGQRSLIDAVDQDQEQQAQVAPENDQPRGPPAQNPSARQGGGGVPIIIGGGGGGDGRPGVAGPTLRSHAARGDGWLLLIAARIALTAPGARQRFTDPVHRHKGAAAEAEALAAGLRAKVGSAADAAGPTLVQLRQLTDNVINDFKASLQQLPLLPVSNTPETVRALTGLTETVESDVKALEELKAQLAVDMAPNKLGRLQQFDKSLDEPVRELLHRQTAYQNAVMELRAAETQKTQAGALLKRVRGILKAANEVAAPGGGLPDLPLLTSWSTDYILEHLPMQKPAAKLREASSMPHQEVVNNLDMLEQRSNLGQQGGSQQPPASPDFRKEVREYIIWAAKVWAKKTRGGLR